MPATLPQPVKGTRALHHHPCASCCVEKEVTVSFPLVFNLSPLFQFFSPGIFPVKLLFSRQVSATLPQTIKGTIACWHHPRWWVVWRRGWWWLFLLFAFPHCLNFFSQPLFQLNHTSVVVAFCSFPFHSSPFISILWRLMFQLKFACKNLHLVL